MLLCFCNVHISDESYTFMPRRFLGFTSSPALHSFSCTLYILFSGSSWQRELSKALRLGDRTISISFLQFLSWSFPYPISLLYVLPSFLLASFSKNINQFLPFYNTYPLCWIIYETFNYTHGRSDEHFATDSYSVGFNKIPSSICSAFFSQRTTTVISLIIRLPPQCSLPSM